ncbi:PREDICTED: olfactory receptor 10A7-like [Galeopterus variegatus]|uniref:Olfactory receptor 10A7-like n=1 Tax=Galeopterus variegatus TaxID=482537 RepID=A0ABM0SDM8_GALVR|nr:PREDICTED: olfactory receptor 10A7-like [Galeopterus variegatus]
MFHVCEQQPLRGTGFLLAGFPGSLGLHASLRAPSLLAHPPTLMENVALVADPRQPGAAQAHGLLPRHLSSLEARHVPVTVPGALLSPAAPTSQRVSLAGCPGFSQSALLASRPTTATWPCVPRCAAAGSWLWAPPSPWGRSSWSPAWAAAAPASWTTSATCPRCRTLPAPTCRWRSSRTSCWRCSSCGGRGAPRLLHPPARGFSTCPARLAVPVVFTCARPRTICTFHYNKLVSAVYTVLTPLPNPVTYGLRNQEVKQAPCRAAQRAVGPWGLLLGLHLPPSCTFSPALPGSAGPESRTEGAVGGSSRRVQEHGGHRDLAHPLLMPGRHPLGFPPP